MSAAKHTPGPWWVTDSGVRDAGGYICHTNPATHYPGQDERFERETAERAANKLLIAAAPDLLTVATRAKAWIEDAMADRGWPRERIENPPEGSHLHAINAAIAKATAPDGAQQIVQALRDGEEAAKATRSTS